jgi:hypothetical protein
MPGFLGGSGSSGGSTGGEISFPKEFIDPVTKLRISNPENLIDTDFEYGLQPTKWETVELINNTPSFFSKSGDTTIPNIVSITTNAGTREITVVTALAHGLAVGIPIQVTGTKSITADGSYIINSIPNTTTFTYLCKDNQPTTASIEDLYSSIITGEFFQGSQLRVSDSSGITTDGESQSTLTVTTESPHGFGTRTPFYFLNLNSTISQEFQAANTAAKSFDASNSATAQTFDGSNTLSSIPIDISNSATIGGTNSTVSSVSTSENTITVAHSTENFSGLTVGTPLYYNVTSGVGFFSQNPIGVVFLKTTNNLGEGVSTFQVSAVPDGDVISIESGISGVFKIANQARTFAGNNIDESTQQTVTIIKDNFFDFEGANDGGPQAGGLYLNGNPLCTVTGYSGSLVNVSVTASAGLGYYQGAMLKYSTTGSAATGLTNNATYFVDSFFSTGTDTFAFTLKEYPNDTTAISISGGTGTQTFTRIGVSVDKDIVHIKNSNFQVKDMIEYSAPENGEFTVSDVSDEKQFYFVETVYDTHNYKLSSALYSPMSATGGALTQIISDGRTWNVHTFTTTGTNTFTVTSAGSTGYVEYLLVGGGGGGGGRHGGGGGGGGVLSGSTTLSSGSYTINVGVGGNGATTDAAGGDGGSTTFNSLTAFGGGGGGAYGNGSYPNGRTGGSGGGGGHGPSIGAAGVSGQGFAGGNGVSNEGGGGGGAGGAGSNATDIGGFGGVGRVSMILGRELYFGGGGGGATWDNAGNSGGFGGAGGGGGGGHGAGYFYGYGGTGGFSVGGNGKAGFSGDVSGGDGAPNTGGGGGGLGQQNYQSYGGRGGNGGSGVAIIRYPVTPPVVGATPIVATGGTTTTVTVGSGVEATQYRVHTFTTTGNSTFAVSDLGNLNGGQVEVLMVAGGGGGGSWVGGGGGGGGVVKRVMTLNSLGNYTVTVGAGGGGVDNPSPSGYMNNLLYRGTAYHNGGNSTFNGFTAIGGGHGGAWQPFPPAAGGSGGGAGYSAGGGAAQQPSSATGGFGNAGGNGRGTGDNGYPTGGGGGAGAAGQNWSPVRSGYGGVGYISAIGGSNAYYGGGGGGGVHGSSADAAGGFGSGAYGGGGNGLAANTGRAPSGTANTGGGGGGNGRNGNEPSYGGNGGSGIVIIRYPISVRGGVQ